MTAPDPYAGGTTTPSLSFKDAPIGTSYTGTITHIEAELVQSRDFETNELAHWPAKDGKPGNPKMAAVMHVLVDGEEKAVWATKPSALFAAFGEARTKNGGPLEVGGTVRITYTGDKPNVTNPRMNPAKQYTVDYKAPVVDVFNTDTSTSAGQPWSDAGPATGAMAAKPSGTSEEALEAARQLLAGASR